MSNNYLPMCPHCATSLTETVNFCPKCGKPIENTPPQEENESLTQTQGTVSESLLPTPETTEALDTSSTKDEEDFFSTLSRYNNIYITYPKIGKGFMYLSMLLPSWGLPFEAWDYVGLNDWIFIPIMVGAFFIPLSQKIRWIYIVINSIQLSLYAVVLYINYLIKNDLDTLVEYVENDFSTLNGLGIFGCLCLIGLHYLILNPLLSRNG